MTKGDIVGHIVIDMFSLMSKIYQLAENVKQYAEIGSVSSGGGSNRMQRSKSSEGSINSGVGVNSMQRSNLEIKSVRSRGGANSMKRSKLGRKSVSSG